MCKMNFSNGGVFMHKNDALKRLIFALMGLMLLFLYSNNIHIAQAADNADYQNALKTAPKGLKWSDDTFVIADFQKAVDNRKHKTLDQSLINPLVDHHSSLTNNVEITTTSNQTSVIKMTNDNWQTGAVWSNKTKSNYFDITHEQIASMWLYFGKINQDLPGDGMAFVLQNDPNGENSIALSADGTPVNGQSLGVWGADWNVENEDPNKLAATAIQNSWALEFDTFVNMERNYITGEGVSFDSEIPNVSSSLRHIAGNYPASPDTYKFGIGYPYYFSMVHNNLQAKPDLVDSKWHHVTIKWTPNPTNADKGDLTYKYNDKDPVTGMPIKNPTTSTFTLDTKKFGLNGNDKKLYWGFTGSTGRNSENNLVIFESIPSFVSAEATSAIYDDTQGGQEITDSYNTVDPNSNIRYKYSLKYKGWSQNWHNIDAIMGVPDHVHFTSGTVTYPNSPLNTNPRPIPESVFQNPDAKQLEYLLPEQLDANSRDAIIELNGTTEKVVPTSLTVPAIHTPFDGDNLITDTITQSFKIRSRALSLDSNSPNPIRVKGKEDVTVPGHVTYADSSTTPSYSSLTVYQNLNGTTTNLGNIVDKTGNFNININNQMLDKINTLSFYVTDNKNNTSNTITRQILLEGSLAFGHIQEEVAFQSVKDTQSEQLVQKANNCGR